MRLICSGKCDGGGECKRRSSQNSHGGIREWCGCDDIEPTDCHIVIKTIGRGEDQRRAGQKEIICAGGCIEDPEDQCLPVVVNERNLYNGGTIEDVACECL